VAEGTPAELKRAIGSDVIIVQVQHGAGPQVAGALAGVLAEGRIDGVEQQGDEVLLSATDGAAAISPVAVALAGAGVQVTGLTLRTPTLDDVFLHMTGARLQEDPT
jgi:ABC-2 type transport system ATP-binding protein